MESCFTHYKKLNQKKMNMKVQMIGPIGPFQKNISFSHSWKEIFVQRFAIRRFCAHFPAHYEFPRKSFHENQSSQKPSAHFSPWKNSRISSRVQENGKPLKYMLINFSVCQLTWDFSYLSTWQTCHAEQDSIFSHKSRTHPVWHWILKWNKIYQNDIQSVWGVWWIISHILSM